MSLVPSSVGWRKNVHEALNSVRPWAARRRPAVLARLDRLEEAYHHVLATITQSIDRWTETRKPRRAAAQ